MTFKRGERVQHVYEAGLLYSNQIGTVTHLSGDEPTPEYPDGFGDQDDAIVWVTFDNGGEAWVETDLLRRVVPRPTITLNTLFYSDRTQYQTQPGDETTPANVTVAEVKELMIAVNVSHERIVSLYQELQQAEARIGSLEQRLNETLRMLGTQQ